MSGRVIEVDITWAREQPGRHSKEDNAAAFQVLVAHGYCVGALEVQVFVAGSARATARSHHDRSGQLPPAHTTHRLRQVWRQMHSLNAELFSLELKGQVLVVREFTRQTVQVRYLAYI